jgi:hypothetical protein
MHYVKPEFMNEEICKLAVRQYGLSLLFVKQELINEEICKLVVN